jgi:hypothetical protein
VTGYPWHQGDPLLAADLNAAIANAGSSGGVNAGQMFNVRDHGVKMDGVADDYAALNAVCALASATSGSVVYFPPSPYPLLLSQQVVIGSNQVWWAWPGSVTIAPMAGNASTVLLAGSANASDVLIHGVAFDGGGQDFSNAGALTQWYHVTRLTLDRVTFQNTRGLPFNGSGINDLLVQNCGFRNIGNHWKTTGNAADYAQALTVGSYGDTAWGHRTRVVGCDFYDCGSDCVNFEELTDVLIANNVFTQVLTPYATLPSAAWFAGIFAIYCNDMTIVGNLITGMTGNGIDLPALWDGVISNNIVRNSGQGGIGLFDGSGYSKRVVDPRLPAPRGSRNVSIVGNVVENSGNWSASSFKDGIQLGASTVADINIRVVGNICTDTRTTGKTQQYGVSYSGPASSGIWVDPSNMLSGNALGAKNGIPPTSVTGAKGGNAALASLLTVLAGYGLVTDNTSA